MEPLAQTAKASPAESMPTRGSSPEPDSGTSTAEPQAFGVGAKAAFIFVAPEPQSAIRTEAPASSTASCGSWQSPAVVRSADVSHGPPAGRKADRILRLPALPLVQMTVRSPAPSTPIWGSVAVTPAAETAVGAIQAASTSGAEIVTASRRISDRRRPRRAAAEWWCPFCRARVIVRG